ncbi:MAG TPA: xylulokinase [Trueperaceae bacterium]|nr:xylulokinase [Trueperaceae bacterium]
MHAAADDRTVIGLDIGTSGAKATAVNGRGEVLAEHGSGYPLLVPRPGWTEQSADAWWAAAAAVLTEVARRSPRPPEAIALTGQMHGLVPLDADGAVVRNPILWNDQRTDDAVAEIELAVPRSALVERGGNPAITGFQLAKLVWLRRHEPAAFARTRTVLFPKDYLTFRLTGERKAEPTDASGSNAFDLRSGRWDEEVLSALGLDAGLYPPLIASDTVVGRVSGAAARATGVPAGTPVVAGAGDNAAAATGLGISRHDLGRGSVSLGTSGVLQAPLERPTPAPGGRAHLFAHADGGFLLMGVTLSAAGSLRWVQETLFPTLDAASLAELAATSPTGAGGVTFHPYLAGERSPYLDPDLRGAWRGLSLATSSADLVRAVLEGVAFSLAHAFEIMRPLSDLKELVATGGGSRSRLWVQLLADALHLPVTRLAEENGAAYGAALLGWRGLGADVRPRISVADTLEPRQVPALVEAYERYRERAPDML